MNFEMFRFLIILTVCIAAMFGRRIGRGETRNIEDRQEDFIRDPVVVAEGEALQEIKSHIYELEREEAAVEMDIMERLAQQNKHEKHPYHLGEVDDEDQYWEEKRLAHQKKREKHLYHLGEVDDEDLYWGEGSGSRVYYAM